MRRASLAVCLALACLLGAGAARAHGPTVLVTESGPEPVELRMERGATVHFSNRGERSLRVLGDEDAFHSPLLAPGGGWHLRLPFPGRFEYAVEDAPGQRGVLVVE